MKIRKTIELQDLIKLRNAITEDKLKCIKEKLPIAEMLVNPKPVTDFEYISDKVSYIAILQHQINLNYKVIDTAECDDATFYRLCMVNRELTIYVVKLMTELEREISTFVDERKDERWILTSA